MTKVTADDEREHPTTGDWRAAMRTARKVQGVTQTALAAALGITQAAVSEIERGTVQASSYVIPICRLLKIPPPVFYESDIDARLASGGVGPASSEPDTFSSRCSRGGGDDRRD